MTSLTADFARVPHASADAARLALAWRELERCLAPFASALQPRARVPSAQDAVQVSDESAMTDGETGADLTQRADALDLDAVRGGDQDGFARIVERHQQTIARHMYRFARDPATYEELVQDVFVEAYSSLHSYRGDAPLVHWLRRIATRVGYRHWRRSARNPLPLAELPEPSGGSPGHGSGAESRSAEAHDTAEYVHALLARLRPRDRLVLTLMYLEGCTVEEAATLTGWSRTMVKVQAHRARKRLKALDEGRAA